MKKLFIVLFSVSLVSLSVSAQVFKKLSDKVKDKATQRANQKTDQAIDKSLDKTEEGVNNAGKNSTSNNNSNNSSTQSPSTQSNPTTDNGSSLSPTVSKVYQNYDFIPGEKILFEDNFATDADGEFPSHWELQNGQAVVNQYNGKPTLLITDGNAGWVSPLMKKKKYLDKEWTIEFDTYRDPKAYPIKIYLQDDAHNDLGHIDINNNDVSTTFRNTEGDEKFLAGNYPEDLREENFFNRWHHIAIACKNKQVKIYVDQVRALVIPNIYIDILAVGFGGIGASDGPLALANVRIAEGAGMNMLGKKFTDTKIVTHGINFDVNKAVIKPESMGTLNGIVQIMKDNPEIKFEVGGHTDSDGDDAANLKLSQARADAVRNQLIAMNVDAARLTTKGYGETKPISDNTSPEGKANNRRVEFVKK
ncbi:MAG: OmpA family protein [Ferruginibacter sp.]